MAESDNSESIRPRYWETDKSVEKPASTTLHPEFLIRLDMLDPGIFVDIGAGSGRLGLEIPPKHQILALDINQDELVQGQQREMLHTSFVRAAGENLPLRDRSVDGAFLLGVLSTADQAKRDKIFREASRVVKDNGLIYVAEFTTIDDPEALTSLGTKWQDVYREDKRITGEQGTVIVKNSDGSPKFYAHHFTKDELEDLYARYNVEVEALKRVQVISSVSGSIRDNWNIWGARH